MTFRRLSRDFRVQREKWLKLSLIRFTATASERARDKSTKPPRSLGRIKDRTADTHTSLSLPLSTPSTSSFYRIRPYDYIRDETDRDRTSFLSPSDESDRTGDTLSILPLVLLPPVPDTSCSSHFQSDRDSGLLALLCCTSSLHTLTFSELVRQSDI